MGLVFTIDDNFSRAQKNKNALDLPSWRSRAS